MSHWRVTFVAIFVILVAISIYFALKQKVSKEYITQIKPIGQVVDINNKLGWTYKSNVFLNEHKPISERTPETWLIKLASNPLAWQHHDFKIFINSEGRLAVDQCNVAVFYALEKLPMNKKVELSVMYTQDGFVVMADNTKLNFATNEVLKLVEGIPVVQPIQGESNWIEIKDAQFI